MIRSPIRSPIRSAVSSVFERRASGGVAAFDPATLFVLGEAGWWYDPSDLSTMFQDSAGTIPVTAAGQSVGRMLDKSGRGNHMVQHTGAPTYQNAGGLHRLVLNNTSSVSMLCDNLNPGASGRLFVSAAATSNTAGTDTVISHSATPWATNGSFRIAFNSNASGTTTSGRLMFQIRGTSAVGKDLPFSGVTIASMNVDMNLSGVAAEISARVNGSTAGAFTNGTDSAGTSFSTQALWIGSSGGANPHGGEFYGSIGRDGGVTLEQHNAIEDYLAGKASVFF